MNLRIFLWRPEAKRVSAGTSDIHAAPQDYAERMRSLVGVTPIAWEHDDLDKSLVADKKERWFPRCLAAIEADQHFFPTKGEALAAWAAIRLEAL